MKQAELLGNLVLIDVRLYGSKNVVNMVLEGCWHGGGYCLQAFSRQMEAKNKAKIRIARKQGVPLQGSTVCCYLSVE